MLPSVTTQKLVACGGVAMGKGGSSIVVFNNTLTQSIAVPLVTNEEIVVLGANSVALNGGITGAAARTLSKSGSGTLSLGGSNTYTGQTIVKSGVLNFTTDHTTTDIIIGATTSTDAVFKASLGTTALKTVTTTSGATNNILEYANTGATILTITGALVLNSPLIIRKPNSANSGSISFNLGISGGAAVIDYLIFSNLGGAPLINAIPVGARTYAGNVRFLNSNGSQYTINAGFSSGINPMIIDSGANVAIGASGTIQIDYLSGPGALGTSGVVAAVMSIGNNDGSGTFSGVVSNSTGTIGIIKNGTGTQILSGNNSYTGVTTFNAGVLSADTLAAPGLPCSIGASAIGASNRIFNGGTLRYTGTGHSTNRQFTVQAGGATFDASGSGTMTWVGAPTISAASVITFTGTSIGSFQAVIGGGANGSVTKSGTGTWTLTATNTYTGATQVIGGVLLVNGSTAAGSTVTINAGSLGGTGTINGPTTVSNTANSALMGGTGSGNTGNLTLTSPVTIGGSTSSVTVNTNSTTTVSTVTINLGLLGSVNLNGLTINFGAGQNLNAGTYTVMIAGGVLTSFTGTVTAGVKPANRTSMSASIVGGNSVQVTVA